MYVILETVVPFRPCLTGCNKRVEVVIPPSWVQMVYVVFVPEYSLFSNENIFFSQKYPNARMCGWILRLVGEHFDLPGSRGTVFFFIANAIAHGTQTENAKQFCSALSEKKAFRDLEDLCTPQKPSEKSFEEIMHLLLEHFKLKHLVITKSNHFYNAKQEASESFSNFFIRLKHSSSA